MYGIKSFVKNGSRQKIGILRLKLRAKTSDKPRRSKR